MPDGVTVDADGGFFGADDVRKVETVCLVEGGSKQRHGNFEADVFEVCGGCEMAFTELVDIEGKLGLDVSVRALGVVDYGAVLPFKIREFDRDGVVDGVAVSYGVADVMRKGADGKGEVVGVLRVA